MLEWAFAVLENALGNYETAFRHATQADPGASLVGDQVLLELIESAARSARRDVAVGTIGRLVHRAQTNPGPPFVAWAAGDLGLLTQAGDYLMELTATLGTKARKLQLVMPIAAQVG